MSATLAVTGLRRSSAVQQPAWERTWHSPEHCCVEKTLLKTTFRLTAKPLICIISLTTLQPQSTRVTKFLLVLNQLSIRAVSQFINQSCNSALHELARRRKPATPFGTEFPWEHGEEVKGQTMTMKKEKPENPKQIKWCTAISLPRFQFCWHLLPGVCYWRHQEAQHEASSSASSLPAKLLQKHL